MQLTIERDEQGNAVIKFPEPDQVADLENREGALSGVAKMEVMGLPLGGASIGVAGSAAVSALVTRFIPGQAALLAGPVGKLGLAWAAKQWLSKPLGDRTTDAIAFVLVIDAVGGYVRRAIGNLIKGTTSNNPGDNPGHNPGSNGHKEAADPMQVLRGV